MKSPIFIFSLPRAGSTLLQRMLLAHSKIGGTAEPWLMLPFIYTIKEYGVFAEYSHGTSYNAISDFIKTLPKKEITYLKYLAEFGTNLYSKQLNLGEIYFLDKTPRYYLIIPEIIKMFPDAKFIFLFRNPLEVLSSIINTWNKGKLRLHNHYIDLMIGPGKLAEGYKLIKDKAISIQYEDLVINTDKTLTRIFNYLEIDYDKKVVEKFNQVSMSGRMGDTTGRYEYNKVDKSTLEKWKKTMNSRRRVSYSLNYLKKLGKDTLKIHGYDGERLKENLLEIKPLRFGYIFDNINIFIGFILRIIEYNQLRTKMKERRLNRSKPYIQHM